ncbi:MAG: aspartate aminotransferase family protein [Thomasclavelia sp.]
MTYYDRAKQAFMNAYGRFDVTFDHGKGVYLYDTNGKKYLDFYSGIGVNSFGYDYPPYCKALTDQIHRVMHVSNYFNTVETIEAAEAVIKATKLDQVFFTNSGTEATEGALKLARKYYYEKHGKADSEIISLKHSFHGRSTGSVTLTGNPNYQKAFGPLIAGVKYGDINDLESVKKLITPQTAAIIVEPVQGEGGVYVCTKEFLTGIRQLCDEHDIVMILDEVQCGMGRTGTIMTYFQYDLMPDIVCLAKGIGAGFPIGAFVANKKVGDAMKPGDHGSTYGGNPMAGQACKTVFKILEEENMLEHVQQISKYLHQQLDLLVEKYDFIKEKRGLGLMIGLEFDHPVKPYIQKMLDNGLIMVTAGTNVIRMLPPFIIDEKAVDEMISILEAVINEVNA